MNEQKKERHYSTLTEAEAAAWDAEIEEDVRKAKAATKRSTKSRRQKFQTNFIVFPLRWVEMLEYANVDRSAYRLALRLLVEAYAREHLGGDVVLSSEVTKLPRNSKYRAAKQLQALGLIRIERRGAKQSPVVHIVVSQVGKERAP